MKIEWLKNEMKNRGIPAKDIAQAIGLDDAQMSRALNGGRKLSATEADNIRRYLGYLLPEDAETEEDARLLRILMQMSPERKKALEILIAHELEANSDRSDQAPSRELPRQ